MPRTPLGVAAYNGLAVPLRGESEIRQEDSSRTIMTMTHSTANTGRFMTYRDNVPQLSSLNTQDLSWISSAGQFVGPLINVVSPTTGANYQITSTQNGTLFNIGANAGTSQLLLLPVNPNPGFWFKVFVSTQDAAGDFQINSTADSSAKIVMAGYTSAVSSGDAIEPASTLGTHSITMTAMSSILWLAEHPGSYANAATTDFAIADLQGGAWTSATTG